MASADEPELLVIDTDGGGDDIAAILLALNSKHLAKVLAITCCFGNTSLDHVCANIMRILTVCKETNIPVYKGCEGPWIKSRVTHLAFGTDGLGNVGHEFSTGSMRLADVPAPLALIQLAKKHPKKIHLIAIGPLSNVAAAHRMDPQFLGNLKSIVCMGGNYKGVGNVTEVAEFNFHCDPESAHIILTEATCPVVLVPWEAILEHGILWDTYEDMIKISTSKGRFMKRINDYYVERGKKKGNKRYMDADFLAVAALLYPECVKNSIESAAVVECHGTYTRGQTVLLRSTDNNATTNKIKILTDFNDNVLNKLRFKMLED